MTDEKIVINKMLSELDHKDILNICHDSYCCSECPLYLYDVHFCMEKYKNLRKVYDRKIEVVIYVDRDC